MFHEIEWRTARYYVARTVLIGGIGTETIPLPSRTGKAQRFFLVGFIAQYM